MLLAGEENVLIARLKRRNALQLVSDFDRGAYRDYNLSYCRITARIG